jgi:hypothetical protein
MQFPADQSLSAVGRQKEMMAMQIWQRTSPFLPFFSLLQNIWKPQGGFELCLLSVDDKPFDRAFGQVAEEGFSASPYSEK